MQRRNFLKGSTAAIATLMGATSSLLLAAGQATARAFGIRARDMADFRDCVGTWFHVDDGGWKSVELVSVTERHVSHDVEQFSCLFRGSSNWSVGSGLHDVHSDLLGEFQLYLEAAEDDGYESYVRADFALLRFDRMREWFRTQS